MHSRWLRLAAASFAGVLLVAAYHRTEQSNIMADAANHFLDSLTPEQKLKVAMPLEDEKRFDWHFVPKERKGLTLREMEPHQQRLATALLAAGLSQQGFIKATTIMSLEDVLKIMEKDSGERRNPAKYHFTIFGTPAAKGTWAYSVEGHHLSQNYTIVNGKISDSPSFFGTNPAEVREGPRKGLRVLGEEEDYGNALMNSLTPEQQKTAIVDATAYKDVITYNSRKAAIEGKPSGLLASKMTAAEFEKLMALLEVYADNMPDQEKQARMDKVKAAGKNIYFAWAGVTTPKGPHYYRIQTSTFLVEFDNTQNENNHIHSVWRDFAGDFGEDLLKAHYAASHTVK